MHPRNQRKTPSLNACCRWVMAITMAADLWHCRNIICCSTPPSCKSCNDRVRRVFSCRYSALSTSRFFSRPRISAPQRNALEHRTPRGYPCVRALEINQDTLVAVSVGLVSIAAGIAIPKFYEIQIENAANRENDQPCFPCKGTGAQTCRLCLGAGSITVQLGGDEKEVSTCVNCEGVGSLTCTTCQGTGIQPRYLDRREYKDDD